MGITSLNKFSSSLTHARMHIRTHTHHTHAHMHAHTTEACSIDSLVGTDLKRRKGNASNPTTLTVSKEEVSYQKCTSKLINKGRSCSSAACLSHEFAITISDQRTCKNILRLCFYSSWRKQCFYANYLPESSSLYQ